MITPKDYDLPHLRKYRAYGGSAAPESGGGSYFYPYTVPKILYMYVFPEMKLRGLIPTFMYL